MSEEQFIQDIIDELGKDYQVWVGGVTVTNLITKDDAEIIALEWKEKGYDDVQIENIIYKTVNF